MRPHGVLAHAALCLLIALTLGSRASSAAQQPSPQAAPAVLPAVTFEPTDEAATLVFFNRDIVVLRARVLGRRPSERALGAVRVLDDLIKLRVVEPVTVHPLEGGSLISVGSRAVLALAPPDADPLAGDTVESLAEQTAVRLRAALQEAADARRPALFLRSVLESTLAIVVGGLVLWVTSRLRRRLVARLLVAAEQRAAKAGLGEIGLLRASTLADVERRLAVAIFSLLALVVIYVNVTFVLRQFPFTRPWGESMREFLVATLTTVGMNIVDAIPGLFTVAVFVVIARFLVRLIHYWFEAIEQGRLQMGWIHPETARPTRRLLSALVWLFTIVMAYPYLPGSQTEAFKGVSVFVGLMVTFGSSGVVNQIASGFMITYSRALRVGDFVRIGDVEGTVTHLGILSTKVRTLYTEEVTVPNAVVIAQTTTDYSRLSATESVFTPISVTIGYDAPWRQVEALLLLAAARTPGLRADSKSVVLQSGLEDFYVRYTLLVCLEQQESRLVTLNALYSHIQDLFNEYGVQIMSPNYVFDPKTPKIVAKKDWAAAPAAPDAS